MYCIIYLLLVVVLLLFLKFNINNKNISKYLIYFCIAFFVILTLFLYHNSINAIDSQNYKNRFENLEQLKDNNDIGFYYFIKISKVFIGNYENFRLLIGVIYILPIYITAFITFHILLIL